MTRTAAPVITTPRRHAGIAGQFAVTTTVTYPQETGTVATFTGSVYGGPVVAQFGTMAEMFVTEPSRFGDFSTDPLGWVRRFFAPAED